MSILGFDLGTGACKGVAFDENGTILAKAEKSYQTYSRYPGWCELDPQNFIDVIREIALYIRGRLPNDPVQAVVFSSHGETIIPVGYDGKAIAPAFMNADNRGFAEIDELTQKIPAKRIYEITGTPPHPMYGLANILWFKKHEPEAYSKTYKFCACEDFLMISMGLDPICNYSNCSRNLIFDIRKKKWSSEILDAAEFDVSKLSTPVPSGEIVGKLDKEHAEKFGMEPGTIVVSGGFDHFSSSIGSGAIYKGMVSCSAGTYEGLTMLSEEPNTSDDAMSICLNTFCHRNGLYSNFVYVPAGMGTKWIVNEICAADKMIAEREGISVFDVLSREVAKMPNEPTGLFFAPHLVGSCTPYNDPRARGAMYGITPSTTRHMIYKASQECLAYEFANLCSILEKMTCSFDTVRINGGGARSRFALQLRADVSGKVIEQLETDEAPALGVAMLAGVATGVFSSLEDAISKTVRIKSVVRPDKEVAKLYEDPKHKYQLLYRALEPVRKDWKL